MNIPEEMNPIQHAQEEHEESCPECLAGDICARGRVLAEDSLYESVALGYFARWIPVSDIETIIEDIRTTTFEHHPSTLMIPGNEPKVRESVKSVLIQNLEMLKGIQVPEAGFIHVDNYELIWQWFHRLMTSGGPRYEDFRWCLDMLRRVGERVTILPRELELAKIASELWDGEWQNERAKLLRDNDSFGLSKFDRKLREAIEQRQLDY